MNSRDRVAAALAGGEVDRPPAGAWGHRYRDEWTPRHLAEATIDRARRFRWDFVKFQPRATFFAEAFGTPYRFSGHALRAPVMGRSSVPDMDAWSRLKLVDGSVMDQQAATLGIVARELGEDVPVIQTVFSPISVASYLVGRDNRRLVRELRANPEVVLPAFNAIADALIDFSRKSVEAGAAGIFYAVSGFATKDAMPAAVYDELLLPIDRRILESLPAGAWFNVLHLCGSHLTMEVGGQLPAQVVSYSIHNQGNPPLAEARRITGKAVMGGLEQRGALARGPRDEIARQVADAIASMDGGGLLVAPGCSVPPRAPDANLRAMTDAVAA